MRPLGTQSRCFKDGSGLGFVLKQIDGGLSQGEGKGAPVLERRELEED